MGGRSVNTPESSDVEVFFASVAGIAAVLLGREGLLGLLLSGKESAFGPALMTRVAPIETVRPMYAFFVLLPASLAFIAIGVPFFLRLLRTAAGRRLERTEALGVAALAICLIGLSLEAALGWSGVVSLSTLAGVGAWQARAPLERFGDRHGFAAITIGGLALAGLAVYEQRTIAGALPSLAVAPTLVVVAFLSAIVGLAGVTAAAIRPRSAGRWTVGLCWLAALLWITVPLLRGKLATGADTAELGATAVAGAFLLLVGAREWLRG